VALKVVSLVELKLDATRVLLAEKTPVWVCVENEEQPAGVDAGGPNRSGSDELVVQRV
jgi:hypothetical protein